ncbi:hypothetical protein K7X08_024491 [Anisodus acutangulus]|uniref:Uncharacterized protein n=1 Tax=Anisodus acutangulus TaxID=402998 RepID=A0A9Q1M7X1_9SOLA|nr:hypothetical protein K7X08_024491 [Anisodus acutangulus]
MLIASIDDDFDHEWTERYVVVTTGDLVKPLEVPIPERWNFDHKHSAQAYLLLFYFLNSISNYLSTSSVSHILDIESRVWSGPMGPEDLGQRTLFPPNVAEIILKYNWKWKNHAGAGFYPENTYDVYWARRQVLQEVREGSINVKIALGDDLRVEDMAYKASLVRAPSVDITTSSDDESWSHKGEGETLSEPEVHSSEVPMA